MSDLKAFLKPAVTTVTDKVVVSSRFLDDDRKPIPFEIKSITQAENDALIKASTRVSVSKGQREEVLNKSQYQARLVVECVTYPSFRDPELLKGLGVVDPLDAPNRMLLAGEFAKLAAAIMVVNGFGDESADALIEAAKN